MSFKNQQVGAAVQISVSGVVIYSDLDTITLDNGLVVTIPSATFDAVENDISVEVTERHPEPGDVGVHSDFLAKRSVVLFRVGEDQESTGWFNHRGDKVSYSSVRRLSRQEMSMLLFSAATNPQCTTPSICDND